MTFNVAAYNPRTSLVHAIDTRVKIVLVLAFSAALFFVHTWWGIVALAVIALLFAIAARLDVAYALGSMKPILAILIFTIVVNAFIFDVNAPASLEASSSTLFSTFANQPAIPLIGTFGITPVGLVRGCLYAARIVFLILISLVLTTTSTTTEIAAALRSLMRPLERIGVSTHDIATVATLALRFIPVTLDEFHQVRASQTARGAHFDTGGLVARVRAWTTVLVPLFVGLFRRTSNLALALEARCYGGAGATELSAQRMTLGDVALLVVGLVGAVALAIWG